MAAPTDAGLYFSTDPGTTTGTPGHTQPAGRLYVLDPLGQGWEDAAYGGITQPHYIDYLNLNTNVPNSGFAASDFFLVRDGSTSIEYAAFGDPNSTSTYLNVNTSGQSLAALAVEDVGVRGIWDDGDSILYAVENSSVISKLSFGGVASPLTANGVTFDGSAALSYDFLEPSVLSGTAIVLGDIMSLSVASAVELVKPTPGSRVFNDFGPTIVPEPYSGLLAGLMSLLACAVRFRC